MGLGAKWPGEFSEAVLLIQPNPLKKICLFRECAFQLEVDEMKEPDKIDHVSWSRKAEKSVPNLL